MSQRDTDVRLSIRDLPSIVTSIFARAHDSAVPRSQDPRGLFVRYLRRKPGRGLTVVYGTADVQPTGSRPTSRRARSRHPGCLVSLTVDEHALDGAHLRFSAADVDLAPLDVSQGVVRVADLGLTIQAFPADSRLPGLATSCDTTTHGPLWPVLESLAHAQLGDAACRLISAQAEPIRYKPANRCVIRYDLVLEHPGSADGTAPPPRRLRLFGKLYADPSQACSVHARMQRLYDEQIGALVDAPDTPADSPALLPRPLGLIDALGLTLSTAIPPVDAGEQAVPSPRALSPRGARGRGGGVAGVNIPGDELRLAALALARLHTGRVYPDESAPRTGAKEAARVRERAARLADVHPAQAEEIVRLAEHLATRMEDEPSDLYRPTHGGFKPSQLLFYGHHIGVVDFDGFGLADPALDVGYFLAYLRPSGLWYRRPGMRQWFEAAADAFVRAYRQALGDRGITHAAIDRIVVRSRLYEAALLFKIATRRVNRLNSPRPQELSAMLGDIAACLVGGAERT